MTDTATRHDIIEDIIDKVASRAPDVEQRLEAIQGAAQTLWYIANEVNEGMDQQGLMFIHYALLEHITALKAGLYRCEKPIPNVFAVSCPSTYKRDKAS
jgi:hypothetical protein